MTLMKAAVRPQILTHLPDCRYDVYATQETVSSFFHQMNMEINLLTDSGWFDEGISYNEPIKGNASVYRFNITTEGRHFYTANEYERDLLRDQMSGQGWIYEGAAFNVYGNEEAPDDAVPIVRYFNNTQGHLYSSSSIEQDILNSDPAWINEGIAWYGEAAI